MLAQLSDYAHGVVCASAVDDDELPIGVCLLCDRAQALLQRILLLSCLNVVYGYDDANQVWYHCMRSSVKCKKAFLLYMIQMYYVSLTSSGWTDATSLVAWYSQAL